MKSIILTLLIGGTALILAPIAALCHQNTKTAEVLPYLVAETELDDTTNQESNSVKIDANASAYLNKRIEYLKGATEPLETPNDWKNDWFYRVVGAAMVGFGIFLAVKLNQKEKEGTLTVGGSVTVEMKK